VIPAGARGSLGRTAREVARRPHALDGLLAGGLFVFGELEVQLSGARSGPRLANAAVIGALTLGALAWRRAPLIALAWVFALATLQTALLSPVTELLAPVACVVAANYGVALYAGSRAEAIAAPLLSVAGVVVVGAVADQALDEIPFPIVVFCWAPWLLGRLLRQRMRLNSELEERAVGLERERAEVARQAVAQERTRIARELHDVVAHGVSVMVVQAAGAQRIAERDPERAAEAAELIESTGREALVEMRRLFGALHKEDADIALDAHPSLGRVDALAERTRAAGLPVDLRVEGRPMALPRGLEVVAYRVLEEALTNALRHAGPARASVTIRYRPHALELEVADDGRGAEGPATVDGNGLVGMRERVTLYGGELRAGRRRGGGFAVKARIPLQHVAA
jgi:signal transduction histidine kinase